MFTKPKSDGQKGKRQSACAEVVTASFQFWFWKNWKSSKRHREVTVSAARAGAVITCAAPPQTVLE